MTKSNLKKYTGELLRARFCKNLQRLMKQRDLNNAALAAIMGLSATEIWRYASGQTYPNIERLAQFCETFQVEPSRFLRV